MGKASSFRLPLRGETIGENLVSEVKGGQHRRSRMGTSRRRATASLRQQRTEYVVSVGQEALPQRLPDTLADGGGIDPESFDIVPQDASWLHRERRAADKRFAIPASDLLHQVPACNFCRLTAKRELAEITPNDREIPIICIPETVDSRKEVVDGQRREEGIHAYHGRTIFVHTLDVSSPAKLVISSGIRATGFLRPDLFGGDRSTVKQRCPARLVVVHGAGDGLHIRVSVRNKFDSNVDVRNKVIGSDTICEIATFRRVDAAKDDIALAHPLNRLDAIQIHLECLNLLTAPKSLDSPFRHQHLWHVLVGIGGERVENSVEIFPFDDIGIDQYERADAEAGQLLYNNASGPGATDNCDPQVAQA